MDDNFPEGMLADIEKYMSVDYLRKPGADIYPGVFETNHFFPLQRQRELSEMIRVAKAIQPKVVMEIGADKGGGFYHWIKCIPSIEVAIACEIRGTPYTDLFSKNFPDKRFIWAECSSRHACCKPMIESALEGRRIDVLFLDGDKSFYGLDFETYLPLMNPNGIVFMHDIRDCQPIRDDFNRLCSVYRHREIIDVLDAEHALERRRAGLPALNPHENWLRHWAGRSCGVGVLWLGKPAGSNQ